MAPAVLESCLRTATGIQPEIGWTWQSRSSLEEARPVVEFLATAMAREGYPDPDIFEMRQALQEAIVNAICHGNRGDPGGLLQVRCEMDPERVLLEVADDGGGFDLEATDGPGLALMRRCSSWVRHNDTGNSVTLCKYRSEL
jgi:serine/threonine-protein kinase RsbW